MTMTMTKTQRSGAGFICVGVMVEVMEESILSFKGHIDDFINQMFDESHMLSRM